METSALYSLNIEEAFKKLILEIYIATIKTNLTKKKNEKYLENDKTISSFDDGIKIKKEDEEKKNVSKCKC